MFCNKLLLINVNFTAETCLLGFQHYLVMLGTTVLIANTLVPRMGGSTVSFCALNLFFFFLNFILWKLNLRARIIFNPKLNLMGTTPLL
jgi:xanthine/uracil permease